MIDGSCTLRELGITNGAMLVIRDTLLEHKIEKSYVEDGVLIGAGIRIVGSNHKEDKSGDVSGQVQEETAKGARQPDSVPSRVPPPSSAKKTDSSDIPFDNPYAAQVADVKARGLPRHNGEVSFLLYGLCRLVEC